jgi:quercetin dioxygenase-like cupin family protein
MNKVTSIRLLTGLSLFSFGLITGVLLTDKLIPTLIAQTIDGTPQRIEQKRTDLTGAQGMEVIASISEYKTGERLDLHFHHGVEAAFVIEGALVKIDEKEPRRLPTHTTLMNLRDIKHGGIEVVGDSSLKLFTVHVVDRDKPLYDYVK